MLQKEDDYLKKKKYEFAKLTPVRDADIRVYKEAIDFALNEDDIRNVAISGAYGAGKSSVLETYKENNKDIRFLSISLARFQNDMANDEGSKSVSEGKGKKSITEAELEAKIINQLIHWVSPKRIPLTNFKIKRSVKWPQVVLAVLFVVIFTLGILYQQNFWGWRRAVIQLPTGCLQNCFLFTVTPSARVVGAVLTIIIGVLVISQLVWLQVQGRLIRNLSISGNSIELNEKDVDSYFDKYLDEVLYLFRHADVDVIVFEDLDRYNANQIFGRLREVNTLVNSAILRRNEEKQRKTKRKAGIIEILTGKGKNKRPIKFFYLLRDDVFVSKDRTKFFDLIIPIVPIVDGSNSFDQLLKLLKQQGNLSGIKEEVLQDISLYIDDMRVLKNICNELIVYRDRIDSTELDPTKMLAIITYKNLFPKDYSLLQLGRGYVYQLFEKKKELISEELNRLSSYATDQEKSRIEGKLLRELITRSNRDSVFNLRNVNLTVKQKGMCDAVIQDDYFELLMYLISNGYIDETYPDYMTYFYGENLYQEDKIFLRSITDRKAKPFDYALKDSKKVFDRIHVYNADQIEALNNDLFEHAVAQRATEGKTKRLFQMIKQNNSYEFVKQYIGASKNIDGFVSQLNIAWPEYFSMACSNAWLDAECLKMYSVATILHNDLEVVKRVNIDECLKKYISSVSDYLAVDCEDIDALVTGINSLGIKFKKIDMVGLNEKLYHRIYEENLYEINEETLELAIQMNYEGVDHESFVHKNLSVIQQQPDSPLSQYVMKFFGDYISVYLNMCEGEIWDGEKEVLLVLNSTNIAATEKIAYLSKLQTKISTLTSITDRSIWSYVLNYGVLIFSEKSVQDYYQYKNVVDDVLCKYINEADRAFDYNALQGISTKEKNKNLFIALIKCQRVDDERVREIITSVDEVYFDTACVQGIPEERMIQLVVSSVFPMNRNMLMYVRSNYSNDVVDQFVRAKFDIYTSIMDRSIIRAEEIVRSLDWEGEEENKLKLLRMMSTTISISGKNYADSIMEHILESKFNSNDLDILLKEYSNYNECIRKCILIRVVQHYTTILSKVKMMDRQLILDLISQENLDLAKRQGILLKALEYVDKEDAIRYFIAMEMREFSKVLTNGGKTKVQFEDFAGKVLEQMKKREWIKGYCQSSTDPKSYEVEKKRQKK